MTDQSSTLQYKKKPKICAIDLNREIVEAIQNKGLDCFDGTLGSQVQVPNYEKEDKHPCFLSLKFPANLHEYDVVIVDLQSKEPVEYIKENHTSSFRKGSNQRVLLSIYPETIFDPRPFAADILGNKLKDLLNRDTLIIIFSSSDEKVVYHEFRLTNRGYEKIGNTEKRLYDIAKFIDIKSNKQGRITKVANNFNEEIDNLLNKYNNDFFYYATFSNPQYPFYRKGEQYIYELVERSSFIPLLLNSDEEVVGFVDLLCKPTAVFVFPQLANKKDFVLELIDTTLPSIYPEVFPFSEQFSWLESSRYYVPNQLKLLNKSQKNETDYKLATANIKNEIERNQIKFQFLHDLITETDNPLVKSVEEFFLWLGFENIINLDETNPEIKEEDLQIPLQNELLVIEIKGIGGTSKDSECSQISKIKYRRSEERNKFDVYALYIVNHQRHSPPHERKNPPFTENQISDARLDKRGLLTTYDLFNLYSNIEQDFISKADARLSILQYGLVKFIPSNAVSLGCPLETHHKGQVVILTINELEIRKDMSIIVCDNSNWYKVKIIEIKLNNIPVDVISNGELGIKLSESVSKNYELWLANT